MPQHDHSLEDRIRDRAYHLWEAAGRPHGRDHDFWVQAQAELADDGVAITSAKTPGIPKPPKHAKEAPVKKAPAKEASVKAKATKPKDTGAKDAKAKPAPKAAKKAEAEPAKKAGKAKKSG